MRYCLAFLCLFVTTLALAAPAYDRVIYVTLDGTRYEDSLIQHPDFKALREKYAAQLKVYGLKKEMQVASVPTSLPSYESQMAGEIQECYNNECPRIAVETIPEELLVRLRLPPHKLAVFASWSAIDNAWQHIPGAVYSNTGVTDATDPLTGLADAFMVKVNALQKIHLYDKNNRYDRYTWQLAWHYFKKYQPTFLWIALQDSDEEAHQDHRKAYNNALSFFAKSLDTLFSELAKEPNKRTLVIVTTDHGRGKGKNWIKHGIDYTHSRYTWALVLNGELMPDQNGQYSTLSIRPTVIEALTS